MSKYDDLKVAELQDLCRERDLKTGRAKAEMIERLEEQDRESAFQELVEVTEEMGLYDRETPVEAEPVSQDPEPSERPADARTWVSDGAFHMTFPRDGKLGSRDHEAHLLETRDTAEADGLRLRGPVFRARENNTTRWLYKVWVQ